MKVDQLRTALEGEADRMDMLPATTRDVGELWRVLEASVASVTNPDLKRLLTALLADPAIAQAYAKRRRRGSFIMRGWVVCWSTW